MQPGNKKVQITSSELGDLWTTYMNDSMAICMFNQFLQHIDDDEIKVILEYALKLSEEHCAFIEGLFKEENAAIPQGFNVETDVNLSAPRLYSDTFYLMYLHNMGKIGGNSFTLCLATSARKDVRDFFRKCVEHSMELFERTSSTLLSKGLFLRPPQIEMPKQVDFVQHQSFLNGWFGDRRPLNAVEIMNLFFNIERNQIGKSLVTGFSQTTTDKEVANYFVRAKEIAAKHIEIFGSALSESELPSPMTWDTMPTTSTTQTFSDKLMMFHATVLTGASVSHYGTSMGTSPRRDIGVTYNRIIQEVLLFAEDGTQIMINRSWLEQPPQAPNRSALVKKD
ncbi:DUF3231 family protein [Halalkalibacter akibai]|uniref:DUF3231 family protein n=1 Tax=Halalkalibacter akibai (strain ATCC 43226 / DSM 21942 / CIP 109018 / JCM 9157 / 1139) TaxID=1236973 RepID=W4QM73_HALA3|nr:DUF3231 family protein [Halalkalibacter akibai]GAE33225.1 hypothetical protein JCM9157_216 [Halalkalibacter akibai JCM 9157]